MPLEDRLHPFLKHYTAAPQSVKSLLGGVYAWMPASWRYGERYAHFLREIERSGDVAWTRERALHKLHETLAWATESVPAYREFAHVLRADASPLEALACFPLLDKERIKASPDDFLSSRMPPRTHLVTHTGGSTSVPMRLVLQKYVSRSKDYAYNGSFDRVAGVRPQDTILALRGRTVPGAGEPGGPLWMFDPIKRYLHLSCDHLEPEHMPRYLEALRRFQPGIVHAFPSAIVPLARWLEAHPDAEVTGRVRAVQLFSENVYEHQVELIERVFGCAVLLDYGHSERAVKAISVPGDRRYFFWPLYGHVEIVDFQGRPVTEPGILGEIVATGFDNRVMPLLRYRTGDLAMWSAAPNTTRPGFAVVDRIEGRLQEFLVCRDRRLVSIATIGAAHFEELAHAERMQFEQHEPGRAVLKVQSRTELAERARLALVAGIRAKTQGGLDVEIVRVDEIARTVSGKHRLLVQKLDLSGFLGASV